MRVNNQKVFKDVSVSGVGTPTYFSETVWLGHIAGYSLQAVTSGTASGTLTLQASNDEGKVNSDGTTVSGVTNWSDLPNPITVTGAGAYFINVADSMYAWTRARFTCSSGSGSISARAYVKGV